MESDINTFYHSIYDFYQELHNWHTQWSDKTVHLPPVQTNQDMSVDIPAPILPSSVSSQQNGNPHQPILYDVHDVFPVIKETGHIPIPASLHL